MGNVGVLLIAFGAWVVYCGWYGMNPAKTGLAILQDPDHASDVLQAARLAAQGELQTALSTNHISDSVDAAPTVGSSGDAGTVVAFARKQIGKRYVLNGSGPDVWDCSGLVQAAYKLVGITVLHSALAQSLKGTKITRKADLLAGDLLFPTGLGVAAIGDHVQIYSGANTVIEAANPASGVREIALSHWWPTDRVVARRYIAVTNTKQTAGDYYGAGSGKKSTPTKAGTNASSGGAGYQTGNNYYGAGNQN